jgi:hypothetical protein
MTQMEFTQQTQELTPDESSNMSPCLSGMAVFVGVDEDVVTEQLLDLCEVLAQTEYRGETSPNALQATALDVWTSLATTIRELHVAGRVFLRDGASRIGTR